MRFAGLVPGSGYDPEVLKEALEGADGIFVMLHSEHAIGTLDRMGAALTQPVWHMPMQGNKPPTIEEVNLIIRFSGHLRDPCFLCKSGLNRSAFAACVHILHRVERPTTIEDVHAAVVAARARYPERAVFEPDKWSFVRFLYFVFGNPAPNEIVLGWPGPPPTGPLLHLDIGCGTGGSLRYGDPRFRTVVDELLAGDADIVGIEPADHLREQAERDYPAPRFRFLKGENEFIPDPGRLGTSCLSNLSLHFSGDFARAARAYASRLAEGAPLVVSLPHAALVYYLLLHPREERDSASQEEEAGFGVELVEPGRVRFRLRGTIADDQSEPVVNLWDVVRAFTPYFRLVKHPILVDGAEPHATQSYIVVLAFQRTDAAVDPPAEDPPAEAGTTREVGYVPTPIGEGKTAWARHGIRTMRMAVTNEFGELVRRTGEPVPAVLSFGQPARPIVIPSAAVRGVHPHLTRFLDFQPPMPHAATEGALRSLARGSRLCVTPKADGWMGLRIYGKILDRNDALHHLHAEEEGMAWCEVVPKVGVFDFERLAQGAVTLRNRANGSKPWFNTMEDAMAWLARIPALITDGFVLSRSDAPLGHGGFKAKAHHGVDAELTAVGKARLRAHAGAPGRELCFSSNGLVDLQPHLQSAHPVIVELVFSDTQNLVLHRLRTDKSRANTEVVYQNELQAALDPLGCDERLKAFVDEAASVDACNHTPAPFQDDQWICTACGKIGPLGWLFPRHDRVAYAKRMLEQDAHANKANRQKVRLSTKDAWKKLANNVPFALDALMQQGIPAEEAFVQVRDMLLEIRKVNYSKHVVAIVRELLRRPSL